MIASRCVALKLSGKVRRLPPGSRPWDAMASSIVASSCTGASLTVIPSEGAAASISRLNSGAYGAVSGLKMTATREIRGATFLSNCSHFPIIGAS